MQRIHCRTGRSYVGSVLFAALVVAVIAPAARAETLGFKLRVPPGWIDLGPEAPPDNFARAPEAAAADAREGRYAGFAVNPARPAETITASLMPTGRAETMGFMRDVESSVQAKWQERGPIWIEGQQGAFLVGTIQAEKRSKPERQLLVAVRVDADHHVLVTCTAPADKFAQARPVFEAAVRGSFARAIVEALPRDKLGERFAAAVAKEAPGLAIVRVDADEVRLKGQAAVEIRVSTADLGRAIESELAAGQPRARAEARVFERFLEQLKTQQAPAVPARERVLPRVVTTAFLAKSGWMGPRQPLGATGLVTVYVAEGAADTWVSMAQLPSLGVAGPQLHQLAIDNLRGRDGEVVRQAVRGIFEGAGPAVLRTEKRGSARLLLVAESLKEGQRVSAMVPDRDTLVVGPLNADVMELRAAAERAGSCCAEPLLERVMVVSRAGIELRDR